MKKLILLFLSMIIAVFAFQACDDTKTYAEQLEDERNAINAFISKNNIKVITAKEFESKGYKTDTIQNEYVQLSNGVYLQIVNKGDANVDSFKSRDVIHLRFVEYDIMGEDTTLNSFFYPQFLDAFDFTVSGNSSFGQFRTNPGGVLSSYLYDYGVSTYLAVPAGWLAPLEFIKSDARVKLIVPSKSGHGLASQQVSPYYYDLQRIRRW